MNLVKHNFLLLLLLSPFFGYSQSLLGPGSGERQLQNGSYQVNYSILEVGIQTIRKVKKELESCFKTEIK